MNIVGGPGPQVRGRRHAGLRIPVREAPDGAALQRVATPCLGTARARETPVTTEKSITEDRVHNMCHNLCHTLTISTTYITFEIIKLHPKLICGLTAD